MKVGASPKLLAAGPYRYCCRCGLIERPAQTRRRRPPSPTARSDAWRQRIRFCQKRDGAGCFYCRAEVPIDQMRLDHFIPRSRGGSDALRNRRAACLACDCAKADQMPWEVWPERFAEP